MELILTFLRWLFGLLFGFQSDEKKRDLSVYKKKAFLFDAVSEFNLFKVLVELMGDKYYVFPQVNYSHLVEVKEMDWKLMRKYRSSIDKKSADFVICDKERVVPQLVIELDGFSHSYKKTQVRDEFINDLMKVTDLPILHLRTGNLDKESIRKEIFEKLNNHA
jgi:very-short-patch-repair endonuclease